MSPDLCVAPKHEGLCDQGIFRLKPEATGMFNDAEIFRLQPEASGVPLQR
jgi:hypothetical protein